MYIDKIEIGGYLPFDHFGIRKLTIDAVSPTQIVTGDNGSGKSSLLKEAFPLPGTRSLYHKEGYKKVVFRHNGHVYETSSVFNKKNGLHSFKEDGLELNVNNTSTLQANLCESKLGYTPMVHDLIHCNYKWCNMSNGERKALLMKLAPATPAFLIELYKDIKTKYREAKGTLNLLYTRKKEIEEKLIPNEILVEHKNKIEKLNTAKRELENYIYLVQSEYKKLLDSLEENSKINAPDVERIKKFKHNVYTLFLNDKIAKLDVDTSLDIRTLTSQCEAKLSMLNVSVVEEGNKLQTLYNEKDNLVKQLETIKEKGDITKQSEILKQIYKEFDTLQIFKDLPLYKREELSIRCDIVNSVQTILSDTILNSSTKIVIPTSKELTDFKEKLNDIKSLYEAQGYQKQAIDEKISVLVTKINTLPKPPSVFQEECTHCGYFNCHIQDDTTCNNEKKILSEQSSKIDLLFNNTKTKYLDLKTEYEKMYANWIIINSLIDKFSRVADWRILYTRTRLTEKLNDDPWKFIKDLQYTLKSQESIARYKYLENEIKNIETKLSTLKEANLPALEMIDSVISKKEQEITHRTTKSCELYKEINVLTKQIESLKTRMKLEDIANTIKEEIEVYDKEQVKRLSVTFLKNEYIPALMELKQKYTDEAFEIEKVVREQESLLSRYNEEILMLIDRTSKDKIKYELGEAILSPESGLPKSHLIGYVNSLIRNVNFVLSKICTSPFYIKELKVCDDFSCNFIAECNDNQHVPLDSLSKGQTSLMNFAWSIALIFSLKLTDYPLVIDECTDGLDERHKQNFLEWINLYGESNYTSQLWLVDHDAAMSSGFASRDLVCLHRQNVTISEDANVNVSIEL